MTHVGVRKSGIAAYLKSMRIGVQIAAPTPVLRASGEIGSRGGFKIHYLRMWGFKSLDAHQILYMVPAPDETASVLQTDMTVFDSQRDYHLLSVAQRSVQSIDNRPIEVQVFAERPNNRSLS